MPTDEELNARLAALEAEVKADADAQRARKDAALAKLREQQAAKQAEQDRARQAAAAASAKKRGRAAARDDDDDGGGALDNALMVARGAKLATQAKAELARPREKGEKSWLASAALSFFFGPLGWLYAGSFREAVPAGAAYVLAMMVLTKFVFLLYPALILVLPLSAIAGLVYAVQFNRTGKRQRLFDKDKTDKAKKLLGK